MSVMKELPANKAVETLALKLRRRQIVGAHACALQTLLVLRQVVSRAKFSQIEEIIELVRAVGRRLSEANPKEYSVGNTVRKILKIMREEHQTTIVHKDSLGQDIDDEEFTIASFVAKGQPRHSRKGPSVPSSKPEFPDVSESEAETVDTADEDGEEDPDKLAKKMKPVIFEAIQDVLYELETVYDNVSKNAKEHVHSDEIILTLTPTKTVMSFLKSASQHRNYTLLIASPSPLPASFAPTLNPASTQTYIVPFSSIHTLLTRCTKLLLPAHAILANGGFYSHSGARLAAEAAKAHSVNVVVVSGQYKVTPVMPSGAEEYGALDFGSPDDDSGGAVGMHDGALVDKTERVVKPFYDYVGPECVDVFITNDGDHPPSSIYRILKESYDDEDTTL
ncbi:eukaryotic translation initiation factor 2B beta subunit [Flagelloscypha sp. PMI_526]|nr:eukaryotic translation initiation factor 2B beta subunit [Flagelloscypha sp. PMI_526]